MNKRFSILVGVGLVLMGGLALAFNLIVPTLGLDMWHWGAWRLWPLIVVGAGLLFVVPPFLARGRRGLGGLFIPGVPILATGGILLFASVFGEWSAWEWLWPLEVLALALGFLFAAIYMRNVWLLIPAIIVGANGGVIQFCASTGMWESWAVLWTVEPLSLGLALLIISMVKRSAGLFIGGIVLCGLAGIALIGMTAVVPVYWLLNLVGPVVFILIGLLMLVWGMVRRPPLPEGVME